MREKRITDDEIFEELDDLHDMIAEMENWE
jgi:hypothetical protein